MNKLIWIAFAGLLIAFALGEECTTNADCHTTLCADTHSPICEHPEDVGVTEMGGLCTCSTAESCADRTECLEPAHPELDCGDDRRHCYDGACICSRFPNFGGGAGGGGGGPGK